MKILILGLGKSGTTALLYKVAAGLPGCHAFSGGKPGTYIGDYGNAVYKHTYCARKGKDFTLYREHLRREHYDRKIWICRDPRDVAVSRMLYRWHRGHLGHSRQYQAHLALVRLKEQDPSSIPFHDICRYTSYGDWPATVRSVVDEETSRYHDMCEFVSAIGHDWFVFSYEDMVSGRHGALNRYLGFEIATDTEVPRSSGNAKVIRKRAVGDWRHWFTQADVDLFRSAYLRYMTLTGYDRDDWTLARSPVIEPEFSSVYMEKLNERLPLDTAIRLREQARFLFRKNA